jgi:hypothetical protein
MSDIFGNGAAALEMARIFKPLAGRTLASPTPSSVIAHAGSGGVKRRVVTFAAPALVLVATVGLAIAYVHRENPTEQISAAQTRSRVSPQSRPDRPAPLQVASQEASALPKPVEDFGSPNDQPALDRRASGQKALSVKSRAFARLPPEPVAISRRSDAAGTLRAPPTRLEASSRGVQNVLDRRDGSANISPCTPGSDEDRCIYQDVLNADARLRTAFGRAQRDGVSNAQLAKIRARWSEARRDADYDPDGTISRYNQLANALDRIARHDPE